MDESTFAARLAETGAAIERELEIVLGVEPRPGEPARPARLIAAMRYATLGGGKRLRPFLAVETARALGRADKGPRRAGVAIECIHAYSLIHDDLPAMDDDDLRRGRPTDPPRLRRSDGDSRRRRAAGAGFRDTGRSRDRSRAPTCAPPSAPALRAPIGLSGMVGGQMLDIDAERSTSPLSVSAIARLQAMKTGALLSFSVEAGARLAGASPAASAALSTYGRSIGAAFQIADDLLDAEGDAATLGKRVRKDAERNKATLVGALGVEGARRELARLVEEAESAVDSSGVGAAGDVLRATARFVATRRN